MKISKYLYGNPIEEWGSRWKNRLLPSARSKVLQKWNASGKKPKPESSNEYTKRRIKEETKRTWRSDAADIAHGVGEGVLALHPYTAIPYYGAKVGQDFLNGNLNWSTALNASIPLFHLSPQAVGLREATNVALEDAANAGSKTARNWRIAREINEGIKQNTKNGKIEVTENYFNSPDKWYRVTETPEKFGILELGKNITTRDNPNIKGTIGSWRTSIIKNYTAENGSHFKIMPGKENNEGYFIKTPDKYRFSLSKQGAAHGNTSQAAKGQIWGGTFAYSGKFPRGILEGQAPTKIFRGMTEAGEDSRTNFILQDWDNVPHGARVGFHTGEMPMSNLGWFLKTKNGTYTYEPIIPVKRITYEPIKTLEPSTSLKFFERKPSRISFAELLGVSKGDRNLPFKSKLPTEHVQGDEAVKMFKEYGGEPIPEGSINGELLRKYVAEARERYGLTNNKNITDEEIAQALYKHSKELGGNTAAVNSQGEPQLLFRGDTRRYTLLKERMSPEELAKKSGTMDNSLGNLFLGEFPDSYRGVDRYIGTWRNFNGSPKLVGSGTGSKVVWDGKTASEIEGYPYLGPLAGGGYKLYSQPHRYGNIDVYKLPASMMESGVNDLNAFIVRTPQMRNASSEISVLNDDWMLQGAKDSHFMSKNYKYNPKTYSMENVKTGESLGEITTESAPESRIAMGDHYKELLKEAEQKQLGLLKSEANSPLRDEHSLYSYFALPNFNIQGAKHLLPYDLRIPRNWKDKNIYRGLIPLTTGYTLYNLFNQPLQQLQYQKQGGKMNTLLFLKNGSGIHIKKKNRGKFTDYCGGLVTQECINKGKHSSNPAVRKRATFADNARKWKHKEGGKAFVEGVNVLDSNPKAYKYVKKKYKMHLKGGNLVINYIKAIENPNRVGWNGKVWQAPNLKGYDINLRGYGIDINTNQSAKKLTNGRPGRWITDAEATKLMNDHISYITNVANKHIKGFNKLSPQRQAALLGMLYRGDSVNKSGINYLVGDDKKFFTSIGNYYRSKGLNERADNSDKFFKRYLQQGGSIDWNSIANVGVNLLLNVVKNKQISKEAEAAKAMNKLTSRNFFNIYNLKLQEAKLLEELLARTMPGTTINSSNIVAANRAWKNASGEYAALKNNVDLQNRAIDAQAQALKSDTWGNAISGVMLLGMGMLNNYLNSKSSKTPNISFNKKVDFGNIKTDVGLFGTYSINSGYLPKQLSFDWSKVGNIK